MKLLEATKVAGGVEKYWQHVGDDGREKLTIETVVDVEPILKRNKQEINDVAPGFLKGDMHKVASIPGILLDKMAKLHGITFSELMLGKTQKSQMIWNELLNGRDFQSLRTKPGRVDVKRGIR